MKVELIDSMGSDLTVANSARVSYDKHKDEFDEADARLINYLGKHKHYSPFGHCFATFRVEAPVYVARQLVKHKFLRWNEISRRYVDFEPELHEIKVWRGRPTDSKQGSGRDITDQATADGVQAELHLHARRAYNRLLALGVCPEQARAVLPHSLMTQWYWSGSLDAFAEMCHLRCQSDTQKETQYIATQIASHMNELFPESWKGYLVHK